MEKSQDVRKDYGKIFQDAFLRMIHFNCFCNCISPVKGQVSGSKAKKTKQNPTTFSIECRNKVDLSI